MKLNISKTGYKLYNPDNEGKKILTKIFRNELSKLRFIYSLEDNINIRSQKEWIIVKGRSSGFKKYVYFAFLAPTKLVQFKLPFRFHYSIYLGEYDSESLNNLLFDITFNMYHQIEAASGEVYFAKATFNLNLIFNSIINDISSNILKIRWKK